MYDIIIIGGGPAGLTAATYARRAGKTVLVIEKSTFGGQITWSPKVENFPSVVSISGAELGDRMMEQAMEQGAELELEEVVAVDLEAGTKTVICESGAKFSSKAIIVATGAKPRMLGVEREEELVGSGVGFCAVCDGAFYKGKAVAVCGGGNSALQDAVLLSEKCSKVYLIHRRDTFRGEAKLVETLKEKDNIEFIMNAQVKSLIGDSCLRGIEVTSSEGAREIAVEGLFVAVGHQPDLKAFESLVDTDARGYASSDESCLTKTPGVFVAGDCRSKTVNQLTTAVSDGAVAALAACAWLNA